MKLRTSPVIAALVVALGPLLLPLAPAEAALPSCNSTTRAYTAAENEYAVIPTYRNGSVDDIGCLLGSGNSGSAVRALQTALNRCHGQPISVDGSFGPQTRAAVVAVQRAHGLRQDGVYGPATRSVIRWPLYSAATGGLTRCL